MLDFDMKTVIFWWIRPLPVKKNRPHLLPKPSRSNGKTDSEAINARLCDQTKHILTLWLEADMVLDQILDRDTFNMQPGQRRPASVPLQDPSGSLALVGSSSSLTRVWNTWIEEPVWQKTLDLTLPSALSSEQSLSSRCNKLKDSYLQKKKEFWKNPNQYFSFMQPCSGCVIPAVTVVRG